MSNELAKAALNFYRSGGGSIRDAARAYGVTVDEIHNAANCLQKHACKGGGCRVLGGR